MNYFEVVSVLEERIGDLETVLATEAKQREEALNESRDGQPTYFVRQHNAAVIPVRGILMDEWSMYGPRWGATGYNYIRAAVEQAAADSNVAATIIDYDSPGGLVSGMEETAQAIERSGKAFTGKPVFSIIRSYGASACYALACNGDAVFASPSSIVGSIGAKLSHISVQRMMEHFGVKVTEITSHPGKADASPYRDLSDAARARLQAGVDDSAEAFVQMVARRRHMSADAIHALNAEVFPAKSAKGRPTALSIGLIDDIGLPDDMIREILSQTRR